MEENKPSNFEKIRMESREKILELILAGFGFVTALAWNEAIKSLIDTFFKFSKDSLVAKFIYAIFLTVIIVIVSIYLSKLLKKENE